MKKFSVFTALLFCSVVSFAGEIEVMSFNIRYGSANDGENSWNNRKALVFDLIRHESPDVIGLQEALRFQLDEIVKAVPGYDQIGIGREGGDKGEFSAILYKKSRFDVAESDTFWLSDTPDKPTITWGNTCVRICTWAKFIDKKSNEVFYHFNTHLDHRSQPSREKSAQLIARRIQERTNGSPFVLTGDFNAGEDNPAILYLKGISEVEEKCPVVMVDTFRVLYPDEKVVGTFNGFKGDSGGAKIDYIFTPPGLKVLKAAIIRPGKGAPCPSDHFPVSATLVVSTDK